MAQKKNYWYVLVTSSIGPVFVTKINYSNRTAEWNKLEKPLEMDKSRAQDLALGLNLNFHSAFVVCQPFVIDNQPYLYDRGQFEWKYNESEEKENGED